MTEAGNSVMRGKWKQAAWQLPLLLLAACVAAVATNAVRPDGLALFGDAALQVRMDDAAGRNLVIGLEEARGLFEQDAAVFVDARPRNQYAQGHIRGAVSLPWQEVDRYFVQAADRLQSAGTIITYCDGRRCELSHQLALFLKQMGFENVRVLVNGWTVWQQAGLPTEKGKDADDE